MGTIINNPKFQAFDSNGSPLSAGRLYSYSAGTSTEKATYSDRDLTTANTNPVVLDSRGESDVYGSGRYKLVLKTSAGVTVWTMDEIEGIGESFTTTPISNYSDSLTTAISTIGATKTTLVIDKEVTLTQADTVPDNITLKFTRIGKLTGAYTTTINGPIEAGLHQIFDSTVTVAGSPDVPIMWPQWFGADPSQSDNTAAAQKAITAAAGVARVDFTPGVWLFGNTGANTYTYRSTNHFYCLSVPSDTHIKCYTGATLKQADSTNSHLFANSGIEGAGNDNIHIEGGVVDLNQANQTTPATGEQSGGLFHNCTRLVINNIKHTNVREYALRVTGITNGSFTQLHCTDSDGSGYAFGISTAGHRMTSCFFDKIMVESCAGGFAGAVGNGFVFCGDYCRIGSIEGKDNKFGLKIQDTSSYINIDSIVSRGTTGDYGVKVLGTDSSNRANNINVGNVITSGNYYSGYYQENAEDINVAKIISNNDATNNDTPGVWIGEGKHTNIDSVIVNDANNVGITIRSDAQHVNIDNIIAQNSGQTTGSANIDIIGDYVQIGKIITIDDQTGLETVTRGVNINSQASNIHIAQFYAEGSFTTAPIVDATTDTLFGHVNIDGSVTGAFTDTDATPSVVNAFSYYTTANTGATTITAIDGGRIGQEVKILFGDSNTTIDFTATTLKGNAGVNWSPNSGDHMTCFYNGTNWYCDISDNTA